jgi:hypothetical protein
MPKVEEIPARVGIPEIKKVFMANLNARIKEHESTLRACEKIIEDHQTRGSNANVNYYKIRASRSKRILGEMVEWKERMKKREFGELLKDFNFHMIVALVNGYTWNLGNKLGRLGTSEIERTIRYDKNGDMILPIDWVESKKRKERGELGLVKIFSPTYNRIKWQWWFATVKHGSIYSFRMSKATKIRRFVSSFFKENPHLRVYYTFEQSKEGNQRGYRGYRRMIRQLDDLPDLLRQSCPW